MNECFWVEMERVLGVKWLWLLLNHWLFKWILCKMVLFWNDALIIWTYHLYVRLCLIFSAHNWDHCDTGFHACSPIFLLLPLRLASLPISQWFYLDSFSDFDYHISALSIIHIHYHRTRIFSFTFSGHLLHTFQFSLFQTISVYTISRYFWLDFVRIYSIFSAFLLPSFYISCNINNFLYPWTLANLCKYDFNVFIL